METKFNKKDYNRVFSKEHYQKHKEYYKQYYLNNIDYIKQRDQIYRNEHRKEKAFKTRLRKRKNRLQNSKSKFIIDSLTIQFD